MKCQDCDIDLRVTNTYVVTDGVKTQRAHCPSCGVIYTLVSKTEIVYVNPEREQGAYSLSEKLKTKTAN